MRNNGLVKHFLYSTKIIPALLALTVGMALSSCDKKDDDSPKPTNTDISGNYTGTVTIKADLPGVGSNEDTFTDAELEITGSGTNFLVDGGDGTSANVSLSGKTFSSTSGNGYFNKGLSGSVDGDNINFTFNGQTGDTLWSGSYIGTKVSGGGPVFSGPATYNTGSISIEVDGKSFSLDDVEDSQLISGSMLILGNATGMGDGELELVAEGISGPGNYDIIGFTWDEDRYTFDTVEENFKDALVITIISESTAIGGFSFVYDGKNFEGTFSLNK